MLLIFPNFHLNFEMKLFKYKLLKYKVLIGLVYNNENTSSNIDSAYESDILRQSLSRK